MKIALTLAALGCLWQLSLLAFICYHVAHPPTPQPSDVAIVLGARVYEDGTLSETLNNRVNAAYELYASGAVRAIITCGARGSDEPIEEAFAMRDRLLELGVPAQAIHTESASYNTKQNLLHAHEIMAREGLQSSIIVTSDYHLWRARGLSEKLGVPAAGCAAPGPAPFWAKWTDRLRETLSIDKFLLGW